MWRAAGIFGLGMLLAFVVAGVLTRAGFTAAAAYIDPALVLVAAVVFTLPPLRMLRTMARELLEAVLRDLPFEPWLTVEFTADPSWGE